MRPSQVYQNVVAGKPRHSGGLAALEYFGVPDARAVCVDEDDERKQDKRRPTTQPSCCASFGSTSWPVSAHDWIEPGKTLLDQVPGGSALA